jgi:hypothetical protein
VAIRSVSSGRKISCFCTSVSRDPIGVILPGSFAKGGDYIDWFECVKELQEVQDCRRPSAFTAAVALTSSLKESCEAIAEVGSKL